MLPEVLDHAEAITDHAAKAAMRDLRFRGRNMVGEIEVLVPSKPPVGQSKSKTAKLRARFRTRAALEPVPSHLKYDFRLLRCFVTSFVGHQINLILTAAA